MNERTSGDYMLQMLASCYPKLKLMFMISERSLPGPRNCIRFGLLKIQTSKYS